MTDKKTFESPQIDEALELKKSYYTNPQFTQKQKNLHKRISQTDSYLRMEVNNYNDMLTKSQLFENTKIKLANDSIFSSRIKQEQATHNNFRNKRRNLSDVNLDHNSYYIHNQTSGSPLDFANSLQMHSSIKFDEKAKYIKQNIGFLRSNIHNKHNQVFLKKKEAIPFHKSNDHNDTPKLKDYVFRKKGSLNPDMKYRDDYGIPGITQDVKGKINLSRGQLASSTILYNTNLIKNLSTNLEEHSSGVFDSSPNFKIRQQSIDEIEILPKLNSYNKINQIRQKIFDNSEIKKNDLTNYKGYWQNYIRNQKLIRNNDIQSNRES